MRFRGICLTAAFLNNLSFH